MHNNTRKVRGPASHVSRVFTRVSRAAAITVLGLLALAGTAAAAATPESHPMRFNHLTLDQGLSQSNVLAILQDSEGMMWLGTENGLNRFDGYEFSYYKRERGNPSALSNDFIFDIAEDKAGQLWLATNGGGLSRLDRKTGQVVSYHHNPESENSVSSNIIRRLAIDSTGVIWIGTRGAGLDRFDPETETFSRVSLGVSPDATSGAVFAIHEDSAGTLWVGGDHGLTRISPDRGESVAYPANGGNATSLGSHSVRAILEDSAGRLWVGTFGGGLSRLDRNTGEFEHFVHDPDDPATLTSDRISSLYEDDDGRLWVGTSKGLNLIDAVTGAAVHYVADDTEPSSLRDNNITTIFQDRSGLMWFGTKWRGVSTWNPRSWKLGFEPADEFTASGSGRPNVMSIVDDGADTLWIGTMGDGLNAIDRRSGQVTKYRNDPQSTHKINDDRVMSLMRDRSGNIWIGTMTAGITILDPESGTRKDLRHDPDDATSLSANGIMTMLEDSTGDVWVGTFGGGISRYSAETQVFSRFAVDAEDPYSISSNRVTSIAEDSRGYLWVGTDSGGLNLLDPRTGRFHHYRHSPNDPATIAADTVYSVNIDANNTVWVGTHGGGLDRVVGDPTSPDSIYFENTSQKDGLTNDVIYGIQFDDEGWIWMSTNYGISRFHPESGEIRNLHRQDGLQSEEFNFGAHYRSESGELFFGGVNGFNAFDPRDIVPNKVIPLIALTGFFMTGDTTKSDLPGEEPETVELSWRDDVIAFEFAVMDFLAPEQNRFMYKLEGFDKDWIDLGNRNRVTYTDLDDGNYLLRVKAANSEGVWNEAGFALPVHVKAAPWDTWWAYLGYVALFVYAIVGLWFGHRRKLQREEEYSHRLELEVNSRTEKLLDKNKQLRELNNALQESSLSDPLTGLRNRRFVFEEISRDLDAAQRRVADQRDGVDAGDIAELVFMMVDLDNFKPINDTYGHSAGDKMLIELRDVLLGICRRSDFVIRWGGDEFVVIAKQTRSTEAEALAERIRTSIADHNFMLSDGQIVRTTCSIGFVSYPLFRTQVDDSSLDQIISLADGLMYEAKKERNAWVGMLGPSEAVTSFECDPDSIESTSLLFRARRAGALHTFSSKSDGTHSPVAIKSAG